MKNILSLFFAMLFCLTTKAQDVCLDERLGQQDYRIDTADVQTIGIDVDALAFFKDNEFDGNVVKGYSLPGFRMEPRVSYTPLKQIKLEAGLYAIVYDGANKYPSYVFHDIATWKGNEYQHGAHALPFFRATASLGEGRRTKTTIALGDIYGGMTHGIILPLYNPELTLTDDPEMGVQIIADRQNWHSDVWLNWQSYIYEEDTHQEAFTVGWTQRIGLLKKQNRRASHQLYLPVQLLIQHRGGEQDVTNLGVQTISNAAVEMGYEWSPNSSNYGIGSNTTTTGNTSLITSVTAELCGVFAYQQHGSLWPFDFGKAVWASAGMTIHHDLQLRVGAFHAKDFCSLYGSPFFGTLSVKYPDTRFDKMTAGYWSIEYAKTFGDAYTIGAKANGYLSACGTLFHPADAEHPEGYQDASRFRHTFSFGAYLRACPSFILKRLKKN